MWNGTITKGHFLPEIHVMELTLNGVVCCNDFIILQENRSAGLYD